jgi:hypothetical protein
MPEAPAKCWKHQQKGWSKVFQEVLSNPWVTRIVIGLVLLGIYLGIVFGGYRVLEYLFGYIIADRCINVIGFPIIVFFWVFKKIKEGLTWPWRYRNRRLLKEIFGVLEAESLDLFDKQSAQIVIDTKLAYLAKLLQIAFERQEEARRRHKLIAELEANDYAKERKKAFWDAWTVAKRGGYKVRDKFSDYL